MTCKAFFQPFILVIRWRIQLIELLSKILDFQQLTLQFFLPFNVQMFYLEKGSSNSHHIWLFEPSNNFFDLNYWMDNSCTAANKANCTAAKVLIYIIIYNLLYWSNYNLLEFWCLIWRNYAQTVNKEGVRWCFVFY